MASNMVGWFPAEDGYRIRVGGGAGSYTYTTLPVTTSLSDPQQERKIKVADIPLQHGGINIADGKWKSSRATVEIEIAEDKQSDFKNWIVYFYELFMYRAQQENSILAIYDGTTGNQSSKWEWDEVASFNWTWRKRAKNRVAVVKIGLLSLTKPYMDGISDTAITSEPTKPS